LKDHGIASAGKKRPQTNHAHRSVKEILAAGVNEFGGCWAPLFRA
jgi:hypothetical protein